MFLKKYFLIIFIILAFVLKGFNQHANYKTELLGTRDGLISSKLFSIKQDQKRQLWIGSEFGVSVYNGYQFINFQFTVSNEPIGRILCIAEDKAGGIWAGGDRGLFYFKENNFSKIEWKDNKNIAVESLLADSSGNLFIGSILALYYLPQNIINTLDTRNNKKLPLNVFANFNKRVFDVATDNKKNIYLASFDGIFKIANSKNNYSLIWKNPNPIKFVKSVVATSPDSIFWNCYEQHPVKMINGKVSLSYSDDYIGNKIFKNKSQVYSLNTAGIAQFKGNWQALLPLGQTVNFATDALIDAEENIWVTTWEGLLKYKQTSFKQINVSNLIHKEVFSMLESEKYGLLFGGNKGIIYRKLENNIVPFTKIPLLFPNAEVLCMQEDTTGKLWAGSGYEGVSSLHNNKVISYLNFPLLKDNNCEALFKLPNGNFFACTENGVSLINPYYKQPIIAHYPFKNKYNRYPELLGGFNSKESDYFFYGSQGLFKLSNNQLLPDSIIGMPVKSLYITKIVNDGKGFSWVATLGKGLLKCRFIKGKLVLQKQYNHTTGLPSDIALTVLVDKNDNIWCGDYMSISLLAMNEAHEKITTFSENDGLLSSYYQTLKLEQQKNGTIWGLSSTGIFSFNPDSIFSNKLPPILFIDSIRVKGINNKSDYNNKPIFAYNQNSIQFYFTAVCLSNSKKIRYAYRLKNINEKWNYSSDRQVNYESLKPGNYTFELIASNNNNRWTPSPFQFNFTISSPIWLRWWFLTLLTILLAGLILFFFRKRIKSIKYKAEIKQQIAELEAKAIRAQMNPHFIFNSLNAIQETIVLNDFDTSYQYLSKFSKLLRQVLNNSEKNLIPFRDEIEVTQLYLELESLRCKHSFVYEINIDENIDTEIVMFPSLMLQPFIENAIWHGLMHKEGEKKLNISFKLQQEFINCIIEDNGIGIEKAAVIKKQKLGAQYFESKGTSLTRQRILLLKKSGIFNAGLKVTDVKNNMEESIGTKVEIRIPLIKNVNFYD